MAELITVRSKVPGKFCLWERDPAHPGGEVTIVDQELHVVALTEKVQDAIDGGRLEVLSGNAKPRPLSEQPATKPPRRQTVEREEHTNTFFENGAERTVRYPVDLNLYRG